MNSMWSCVVQLLVVAVATGSPHQPFDTTVPALLPWLKEVRHSLHRIPELGFAEHATSAMIQEHLRELNISYTTGWAKKELADGGIIGGTGIVAEIGSGRSPCVALRADMDGLPIHETSDVPYRSSNEGRMHACGHDAHMTMLLGAARLLTNVSFEGTVRLLFQPAEEGGGGGRYMVREGALSRHPAAESIFALHVFGMLPTGVLLTRPGVAAAAAQQFDIIIEGRGGHAAMPHASADPIPTALAVAQAINSLVARTTSPTDPEHAAVVSITAIETSSSAHNIIPDSVRLKGTMRTLSLSKMTELTRRIESIVTASAEAMSQRGRVVFHDPMYPPLINDAGLVKLAEKTLRGPLITNAPPTMASEDFAFYSQEIPSLFLFLGSGSGKAPLTNVSLHSPTFVVDDDALGVGSATLATLAFSQLKAGMESGRDREEL